jgi:hypothetical protein
MNTSVVDAPPVDKSIDECSSTTNNEEAVKNTPKAPAATLLQAQVTARLEELDSATTPGSSNVSTSNLSVFNSTPYMPKAKPFIMSTENVSKIDESSSEIENSGAQDDGKEVAAVNASAVEVDGGNVTSNTDSEVAKSADCSETEGATGEWKSFQR